MSFYLTLPSNSSLDIHPKNNQSQFTTNLAQEINLVGEWEVGLAEIQFSDTYSILEDGVMYFIVEKRFRKNKEKNFRHKSSTKVIVQGGFFSSAIHFVEHVNTAIKDACGPNAFLEYSVNTNKVMFTITSAAYSIRMNPLLMNVLGFSHTGLGLVRRTYSIESYPQDSSKPSATQPVKRAITRRYQLGKHPATRGVDIYQNFKGIFIYCDLVQPRPCGDVMTPLLRTIPLGGGRSGTYHKIFVKPHYIPLARQTFRSVEILLNTDTGKSLSFSSGHTIATLHFRRAKLD